MVKYSTFTDDAMIESDETKLTNQTVYNMVPNNADRYCGIWEMEGWRSKIPSFHALQLWVKLPAGAAIGDGTKLKIYASHTPLDIGDFDYGTAFAAFESGIEDNAFGYNIRDTYSPIIIVLSSFAATEFLKDTEIGATLYGAIIVEFSNAVSMSLIGCKGLEHMRPKYVYEARELFPKYVSVDGQPIEYIDR